MAATHFKALYDKLTTSWDDEHHTSKTDFSLVIPDILAALDQDPEQGKELLSEFARTLRGSSSCSPGCYSVFRETMIEVDPDLGWVFDTGGLPVIDQKGQGLRPFSPHIEGTNGSEVVLGGCRAS